MTKKGRDNLGRFAVGNPGGPGRPKRAVELEYLGVLADCVTLDDWRAICTQTVKMAKGGNPKAREWLANHLLGAQPASISDLAFYESLGVDGALLVLARVLKEVDPEFQNADDMLGKIVSGDKGVLDIARQLAEAEQNGDD